LAQGFGLKLRFATISRAVTEPSTGSNSRVRPRAASPCWHTRERKKRSSARKLLRFHKAELRLSTHHASSGMASLDKLLDVLDGPRVPFWNCRACGKAKNYASRIRCACGKHAPQEYISKAIKNAKLPAKPAKKGGGDGGKSEAAQLQSERDKRKALEKELQDLKSRGNFTAAGGSDAAPSEQSTGVETAADLNERAKRMQRRLDERIKDWGRDSISEAMQSNLDKLRKQIRDEKPAAAQLRLWSSRVEQLGKKVSKGESNITELQKKLEAITKELEDANETLETDKTFISSSCRTRQVYS